MFSCISFQLLPMHFQDTRVFARIRFYLRRIVKISSFLVKIGKMQGRRLQKLGLFLIEIFDRIGLFFGCFRVKEHARRHLQLDQEPPMWGNQLPLLLCEEATSPVKKPERRDSGVGQAHDKDLRDHVKFLKSCGALEETPVEFWKASQGVKVQDQDDVSFKFHSCTPSSFPGKVNYDEESNQDYLSPVKLYEGSAKTPLPDKLDFVGQKSISITSKTEQEWSTCTGSTERCRFQCLDVDEEHDHITDNALSSVSVDPPPTSRFKTAKSVTFDLDTSACLNKNLVYSRGSDSPFRNHCCSPGVEDCKTQLLGLSNSPYPTPLKLMDEMQTPGTVYPSKLEKVVTWKNARIRSQYVYPMLNSDENSSQVTVQEEGSNAHEVRLPIEISVAPL